MTTSLPAVTIDGVTCLAVTGVALLKRVSRLAAAPGVFSCNAFRARVTRFTRSGRRLPRQLSGVKRSRGGT